MRVACARASRNFAALAAFKKRMNTQHGQQLIEVVLTWRRDVVEVRHLDHTHTSLTVGTRPQDDLFLPLTNAASIELLARAPQGWIVTPLDGGAPVLVADV